MRAHEIMESELSPKDATRLERAEQSFKNGFETETARKDAMMDLGRVYEDGLREEVNTKLRDLWWATMDKDSRQVLPGKQAEWDKYRKLMDMLPYNLSGIREKHFPIFAEYGNLPLLKKLVELRDAIKSSPLVPKKRDLEKADAAAKNSGSVIAEATQPLKDAAIEKTRVEAEEFVAAVKKRLAKVGFDPYAIVPRIESLGRGVSVWSREYEEHSEKVKEADSKRRMYQQFLDRSTGDYRWSNEAAASYVKMCMDNTAMHYDSYVAKMNQKTNFPIAADFRWIGDVWGHSDLSVTLKDGTKEIWRTQVIINFSKYGLIFNQWPSRRVK
jgi:hypothetical protein